MTIKQIKKLAKLSYTGNNLDTNKINKIVKVLGRRGLKLYIKEIKNLEDSKTVTLILGSERGKDDFAKRIRKIFTGKKVVVKSDKSLLLGVKIIEKDNVYDFNLKNKLENLVNYINQ